MSLYSFNAHILDCKVYSYLEAGTPDNYSDTVMVSNIAVKGVEAEHIVDYLHGPDSDVNNESPGYSDLKEFDCNEVGEIAVALAVSDWSTEC